MQALPGHVQVLVRVQHHPSRADLIPTLLAALAPLYVEVSEHSSVPPDPWSGYKQCISGIPEEASHVLVIQDDAQPVAHFAQALEQIAERNPTIPVCLFMGALPASAAVDARRAMMKNQRYVTVTPGSFMPLVACLWPREKAVDFLNWSRTHKTTRADDGNAARYLRQTRGAFRATVPSIVQHNDFVSSVKGGRDHVPGAESWRRALFLAEDALEYEW